MITIGIDAGHGGRNRGANHYDSGLHEPALALDIAMRAASILSHSLRVTPELIRQEDIDLRLHERAGIAERAGCAAVVSVHFNWSADYRRHGGELYYRRGDDDGRLLGEAIFEELPGLIWREWRSDFTYRGELGSPGALAITTAYKMPCTLCEFAFLSAASDRAWLLQSSTIDQIARAVASGCEAWAKTKETS